MNAPLILKSCRSTNICDITAQSLITFLNSTISKSTSPANLTAMPQKYKEQLKFKHTHTNSKDG